MDTYLVLTALGKDRSGIVDQLSSTILDYGCNIVDSRMTVLGGEFAIILMLAGKWNELAKLEDSLPDLRKRLDLVINAKRTEPNKSRENQMPYSVEVISVDHPGIVHDIAGFFSTREINIHELNTSRYAAAHTGTPMFAITMMIDIPASTRIATLREEFLDFCDDLNMDAVLEPIKS